MFCNSASLNDFTKGHKTTKTTRRSGSARSTKKQLMISCFTVSSVRRCNSSKLMNREGDIAADGSPGWRWCKQGRSLGSPRMRPQIIRSCMILWGRRWWSEGQKTMPSCNLLIFVWALSITDKSIKKIHSGHCPIIFFLTYCEHGIFSWLMMTHAIVNVSPNVFAS